MGWGGASAQPRQSRRKARYHSALALGVRGVARNLDDGRVEVLAAGEAGALDVLAAWLRSGPPQARVDELERLDADPGMAGPGFTIE